MFILPNSTWQKMAAQIKSDIAMKNKRIIYFIALIIALLALVWDRMNPPNNASAAAALSTQHVSAVLSQNKVKHSTSAVNHQPNYNHKYSAEPIAQSISKSPILPSSHTKTFVNKVLTNIFKGFPKNKAINTYPLATTTATNCQRDIFSPTTEFEQAISPPSPKTRTPETEIKPETLKLVSVMIGKYKSYAQINDKVLHPGQYIAGYQLIAIGHNMVIMKKHGQSFGLYIAGTRQEK